MSVHSAVERIARNRQRVEGIRDRAGELFASGAAGARVASELCDAMNGFLVELVENVASAVDPQQLRLLKRHATIVAVGGSGRGDMAPYSDADLLFLYDGPVQETSGEFSGQVVRDCWDAGLKLGHSVRTPKDAMVMARREPQFGTSLIECRHLWGSRALVKTLRKEFFRLVIRRRRGAFIGDCVASREEERYQHGGAVQQLEPDVKRSLGGLRDLHLIRWVAFANFGTADLDAIRKRRALGDRDFEKLQAAYEFLTRIRLELHFAAGKAQEVLTRDAQLEIAKRWHFESTTGQRAVERFMQEYFRHSMAIADVAKRFVSLNRCRPWRERLRRYVMTHRVDRVLRVSPDQIDVAARERNTWCSSLEQILRVYHAAALYRVDLAPLLAERIKDAVPQVDRQLSPETVRRFLGTLGAVGNLGPLLRSMCDTGVLELVVDEMRHARCLLQFNQYHSYTVDEHSLRAVEAAEGFSQDQGPISTAYRAVHRKELLHLALLLHDLGKGHAEDHCEVGRRIAESTAERLLLPAHDRDVVTFLVHRHLMMSHLVFRRDVSDPTVQLRFSHEVGSPEVLRMLFVMTAADLKAVGPGVWTDWKAELLFEFYGNVMQILSGQLPQSLQEGRVTEAKDAVRAAFLSTDVESNEISQSDWLDEQLNALSSNYLAATAPERIVADLDVIRQLRPGQIVIEGQNDDETGTVDYRILMGGQYATGCFHRIAGVLTSKRLDILSAQINTSGDGTVVDVFRVVDGDFVGEVPDSRIEEVAEAIRSVLTKETTVQELFQRHKRFDAASSSKPISDLSARVVVDDDSSKLCTVIDIFAHDRSGLLYTISRKIFEQNLSVQLAKIATHFDQVVDVFYVTDANGNKIQDEERLDAIRQALEQQLEDFQQHGDTQFVL